MRFKRTFMAASMFAALAGPAVADPVLLTFEGVGDMNAVLGYYNGGAGGNFGVTFSDPAVALVDTDAGGNGDFANEPSEHTVMSLSSFAAGNAVMNVAAGFTGPLSFSYSSTVGAFVNVFSDLGMQTLLASLELKDSNDDGCVGDPNGKFCSWTFESLTFSGTARSVEFRSSTGAFATHLDDIRFDGNGPIPTPVPEPGTWALMALGLAGLGGVRYRARRS